MDDLIGSRHEGLADGRSGSRERHNLRLVEDRPQGAAGSVVLIGGLAETLDDSAAGVAGRSAGSSRGRLAASHPRHRIDDARREWLILRIGRLTQDVPSQAARRTTGLLAFGPQVRASLSLWSKREPDGGSVFLLSNALPESFEP